MQKRTSTKTKETCSAEVKGSGSPGKRREKERPSAAVQSAGSPERGFCCK